jgi:hypothetical protein
MPKHPTTLIRPTTNEGSKERRTTLHNHQGFARGIHCATRSSCAGKSHQLGLHGFRQQRFFAKIPLIGCGTICWNDLRTANMTSRGSCFFVWLLIKETAESSSFDAIGQAWQVFSMACI